MDSSLSARIEDVDGFLDDVCARGKSAAMAVPVANGVSFSFNDVRRLAGSLLAKFVTADGDNPALRIALAVQSPYLFTLLYTALFRLGVTMVPVNPTVPVQTLRTVFEVARIDLVFTDRPEVASARRVVRLDQERIAELRADAAGDAALHDWTAPGSGAIILFTSGTTGSEPKGVVLSRQSLLSNTLAIAERLEIPHGTRLLSVLPPYHTNGQVFNILLPLVTGSAVYCNSNYSLPSLSSFWNAVEKHQIEYVDIVPTVVKTLLTLRPARPPETSSLRHVICGAAPITVDVLETFERTFRVSVLQEYGLTEGACVSAMEGPHIRKRGSVGRALSGTTIEIRDPTGRVCPPDHRGQIFVRGDATMAGYLGGTSETGVSLCDGWLATGDVGVLDQQGFLTISGRLKSIILKGGETIFPEDIERVAHRCEWVGDVMAYGVSDEFYGEQIQLAVAWKDGQVKKAQLTSVLRDNLPRFWWPSEIRSVDSIPRTHSGKIIRRPQSPS